MQHVAVHQSALKHGLSRESLIDAWDNFIAKRPRGDDCWIAIGFDRYGKEIELVALLLSSGDYLIIHGLSPATEKIKDGLGLGR